MPITIGTGLLLIAFTAQWVLKKKLQDKGLRTVYMWIAWIFAIAGGLSISTDVGRQIGLTGLGASIVSFLGLLLLAADLKDKRPDWGAFLLAAVLPLLMKLSSGPLGQIYKVLLFPFQALAAWIGHGFGG